MISVLAEIQEEHRAWAAHNFPQKYEPAMHQRGAVLGIAEEAGELKEAMADGDDRLAILVGRLAHWVLKDSQGIRGLPEERRARVLDAWADIGIFWIDFANRAGFDAEAVLLKVWHDVRQRDFQRFPRNGRSE